MNGPRYAVWGQKIISYGRLNDFEQAEKHPVWKQLEKNADSSLEEMNQSYVNVPDSIEQLRPYIVRCTPHYHYDDNKIGFRLAENNEPVGYPKLPVKDIEEADSNVALNSIKKEEKQRLMEPDFWTSPAQVLHLALYIHLRKQYPHKFLRIDILLRHRYRRGMQQLLRALQEGGPALSAAPFSDERRMQSQQWVDSFFDNQDGRLFSVALADLPKVLRLHLAGAEERQVSVEEVLCRAEYLLFYSVRNREVGSKHVFVGTGRIVTKLVKGQENVTTPGTATHPGKSDPSGEAKGHDKGNNGGGSGGGALGKGNIVYEKDIYYYHPDHLGSSTFISDADGELYQHLENFPFGETWVEESTNTQRTPYHFTAKELDEETGLYYFGARYYDPRTSVWQTTDPILGDYLPSGDKEKDN
ncbi:MAG: RHS repeat-associated core domain-containing protein [Candidatus Electrothrix gigas]